MGVNWRSDSGGSGIYQTIAEYGCRRVGAAYIFVDEENTESVHFRMRLAEGRTTNARQLYSHMLPDP